MLKLTGAFSKVVLTGALSLTGVYATNALADSSYPHIPQLVVRYADLNLTTTEGVRSLYRRLQSASRQVCQGLEGIGLAMRAKQQACYEQALSGAVTKVNLDSLTALHKKLASKERLS